MTQIHKALSYYWNLRDQGKSPSEAKLHTRLRFGVELDDLQPAEDVAHVVDSTPKVGQRFIDCEGDECVVRQPPAHMRPLNDGEFYVLYEDGDAAGQALVCDGRDLAPSSDNVGMGLVPVEDEPEGFGVKPKIGVCSTPSTATTPGRQLT